MTDNRGRKVNFVYPITWDAAYYIYDTDKSGEFVYTSYTWCGNWSKIGKNRIHYSESGDAYIIKNKHLLWLRDFCLTDWNAI